MDKQKNDLTFNVLLKCNGFFSKTFGLLILMSFLSATVFAGEDAPLPFKENRMAPIPIKGKVLDENNNPLAGVTVQIKNTNITTTTNATGDFFIEVAKQ